MLQYVEPGSQIQVRTDSQLLVDQFSGRRRVRDLELRRLAQQANALISENDLHLDICRATPRMNRARDIVEEKLEFDLIGVKYKY